MARKKNIKGKSLILPPQFQKKSLSKTIENFDKKDILLCSSLVFIFFFLGIWNIGSMNTPVTSWTPHLVNESFYIDLKSEYFIDYIYLMQADQPKIDYKIYNGSPDNWSFLNNISKNNFVLSWHKIIANSTTRYLKFVAGSNGSELNEIVIYTRNYTKIPLSKENIICVSDKNIHCHRNHQGILSEDCVEWC